MIEKPTTPQLIFIVFCQIEKVKNKAQKKKYYQKNYRFLNNLHYARSEKVINLRSKLF
jgi:hypothetical protein